MRILIADDAPLIRERLVALLAAQPGVVVVGEARDAPETLAALRRWSPDVLILDWRMPGGGGLQVLRAMQQARLSTMVIVLTNHVGDQYRTKALALGAHCLLDKVSDLPELRRLMLALAPAAEVGEAAQSRITHHEHYGHP